MSRSTIAAKLIGDPLSIRRPTREHVETAGGIEPRQHSDAGDIEGSRDELNFPLDQAEIREPTIARPHISGAHAAGHGPGLAAERRDEIQRALPVARAGWREVNQPARTRGPARELMVGVIERDLAGFAATLHDPGRRLVACRLRPP